MNRFKVKQMYDGIRAELKKETDKLNEMYSDLSVNMETRETQKNLVKDLEERFEGVKAQLAKLDDEAKEKINVPGNEKDRIINAKADLIRCVMRNEKPSVSTLATLGVNAKLGDDSSLGNGGKLLPHTMTNELLHEPFAKNPLRNLSTFTNITNLEVPKITFTLSDDAFIEDGETAKEIAASAETIVFERNKFKVFVEISETVLNGTDTNLVATVDNALASGLAKKEKTVAFADTTTDTKSFYKKTVSNYDIKEVKGKTMYETIISAVADLEDDYAENASVVMRRVDYYNMIKELANGNASLYLAQPEAILGVPVEFCELAKSPVVGDFRYSHFNYDLDMLYDRDKDVKTGMEQFVLTAWVDHKIKMKSAFRICTVSADLP